MSKETAVKDSMPIADWRDIAIESQKLTQKTKSYCSRTVFRDPTVESLEPRDYIILQWRLDFVHPDRYHVTQEAWDGERGEVSDEWVTIGREHYQNAGAWSRTDDGRQDELNMNLRVDSILDIVRKEEPISSEVYKYEGRRYLLLIYGILGSGGINRGFPLICKGLKGTCQTEIWISLETGLFVKGVDADLTTENTVLYLDPTPSSVNYLEIGSSTTGNRPNITVAEMRLPLW